MAKIKVHELAKELDRSSKEVLALLQEKGVEAKVAQSSIEEEAAQMVRKHFGKAPASGEEKKTEMKTESKVQSETPAVSEEKSRTQGGSPETREKKKEQAGNEAGQQGGKAPQKKKKIIFVSNPQNSKIAGGRPQGQGNGQGGSQGRSRGGQTQGRGQGGSQGGNRPGQSQAPMRRTPIRPLTPPSPTPSVQMVPEKPQQSRHNSQDASKTNAAKQAEEAVKNERSAQVQPGTADRPERNDRPERSERPERGERTERGDRPERTERGERSERSERGERSERPERFDRGERADRGERTERSDRGERADRGERPERSDRFRNDRPARGERGDRGERSERGDRGGYGQNQSQGGRNNERTSYGNNRDGRDSRDGRDNRDGRGSYQGQSQGQGRRNEGGGRPGAGGGQGGYRSGGGSAGGGRPYGNSDRDQRGNGGQGDKPRKQGAGKGFAPEVSGKDVEKHREEEKRRFGQEKDKRSKKDHIYEEEDSIKTKPGKFIRPEKKKEEAAEETIKVITLPETITVKDLADKMKIQPSVIVKKLFLEGKIVTVNQEISYEEAESIAMEYEILCEKEVKVDVIEELLKEEEDAEEKMVVRPPVICVMGHVDHGKTSLLDAIRETNVIDKEAGGITQHIGAYTVNVQERRITFLDTPGHEAFTAMRMRGANSTDIAILVVAADDGVMPQTVEAISHAKAAGIEIVVAVNKIDKPGANVDRVKQELTEYELIPVDWGGTTEYVPVSAKTGEGIEDLLETILLTADILELKANPDRRARGLVIEAELDKGRGPVATVLVQKGTLHVGDFISAGASHGKVRAMIDDKGRRVKEATPSTPVEILGLSDVPSAGEVFIVHENDKTAKSYAETYLAQNKEKMLEETKSRMSLDDLFSQIKEGNLKELNLIVKADVQGSVEAVKQSLMKLSNEEVVVKCIHGGVGAINESDVVLASASNAIIIGFNVRPDATAKATAEREGVDVRLYKVIYQAIEDIEAAMKGMLDPVFEEKVLGHAEVRQIFKASAVGNIAGSYVLDGIFQRGCKIRISREGSQVYEGSLASLKRFKDDVKEVRAGFECGLVFEGFDQIQELDIVEAYTMVEVPR